MYLRTRNGQRQVAVILAADTHAVQTAPVDKKIAEARSVAEAAEAVLDKLPTSDSVF